MDQGKHGPVQGMGYGLCTGWFTYFPNGTSDPSLTAVVGPLKRWISSITYSATGVQTIVFKEGFKFANTPRFNAFVCSPSLATSHEVSQVGAYNATTRTLVLQQRQGTTGYAAAADAAAFVTVYLNAMDSTGK